MTNSKSDGLNWRLGGFRLIPYLSLGAIIFALNSATDFNYLVRGYLVLLELQIGIVATYFILARLRKKNKHNIQP